MAEHPTVQEIGLADNLVIELQQALIHAGYQPASAEELPGYAYARVITAQQGAEQTRLVVAVRGHTASWYGTPAIKELLTATAPDDFLAVTYDGADPVDRASRP